MEQFGMSTSARPENSKPERQRQDWLIVFLILLLGFCCVLGAGQYALRFVPSWQLDTNMESNLDLNSEFLTSKPQQFFEPLDPAILTQPSWVNGNVFLTPGAANPLVYNNTPLPTSNASTDVPTVIGTTAVATTTGIVTNTTIPTNTLGWIPIPATSTSKPGPAATNTSPAPLPRADLGISQSDGTSTYIPSGVLTYTVQVTNTGPSNVNGATVANTFTSQVSGASWSCVAVGTVCGAGGIGTINDIVNLPVGATITYTINVNIAVGASGGLDHTATVTIPGGYTETGPLPNVAIDTNTPALNANLAVSIGDGTTAYVAGDTRTYTITVSNAAASDNVIGATVSFSPVLGSVSGGNCTPAGGAICGAWSGTGNINDTVGLPAGSSLTYMVNVTMLGGGNVANAASASLPPGYLGPSPVNATDVTDEEIVPGTIPGTIQIGPPDPGHNIYDVPQGEVLVLAITVTANGDPGPDLVYYELPSGPGILMDWVRIEISDGYNWYIIFDWGNGSPDANTNVASYSPPEPDQLPINAGDLYNGQGVAIDVDSIVSLGNYPYIRITSSPYGSGIDSTTDIDAIEVFP